MKPRREGTGKEQDHYPSGDRFLHDHGLYIMDAACHPASRPRRRGLGHEEVAPPVVFDRRENHQQRPAEKTDGPRVRTRITAIHQAHRRNSPIAAAIAKRAPRGIATNAPHQHLQDERTTFPGDRTGIPWSVTWPSVSFPKRSEAADAGKFAESAARLHPLKNPA